ncbi:PREDICTED: homeobox protein Hox-A1-like, partial [Nicrophorus vespilloides]|uniref:Homeobox protein Hox-A1-like n=1 Tax=Nicrophorus vespilloides TaxID=110193 RepID=A0ABM1MGM4_NICVS
MSDRELDDDHEINVMDTDSRLSHSDSEPRSHCSSPDQVNQISHHHHNHHHHQPTTTTTTTTTTLPFSISNLLGKNFDQKSESDEAEVANSLYHQANILQQRGALGGFVPTGFYTQGVLRVPAHRPIGGGGGGGTTGGGGGGGAGPTSPSTVFTPWTLGLDPVLQRSAAAAAFASQVVKDRLA